MGKLVAALTPELAALVRAQPLFFVATAPLVASGHVNVSPKGLELAHGGGDRLPRR